MSSFNNASLEEKKAAIINLINMYGIQNKTAFFPEFDTLGGVTEYLIMDMKRWINSIEE